jgi:preprotein translocase subunit SecG
MSFLIGLLTVVLVLDCVLLILLVLIQLPKKEAGAGVAFGGAATDALFGAGTGNVLTKVTKYATIVFFALAIIVGMLQSNFYHRAGKEFTAPISPASPAAIPAAAPNAPATAPLSPAAIPAEAPAPQSSDSITTPTAPPATNK